MSEKTIFLSLPFGVFSECKVASWQHEYKLSSWDQGGRANWTVILYWYLKFYNHVILFVRSETLGTFIKVWLVSYKQAVFVYIFHKQFQNTDDIIIGISIVLSPNIPEFGFIFLSYLGYMEIYTHTWSVDHQVELIQLESS